MNLVLTFKAETVHLWCFARTLWLWLTGRVHTGHSHPPSCSECNQYTSHIVLGTV